MVWYQQIMVQQGIVDKHPLVWYERNIIVGLYIKDCVYWQNRELMVVLHFSGFITDCLQISGLQEYHNS